MSNTHLKSLQKGSCKDIFPMKNDRYHRITNNSTLSSKKSIVRIPRCVQITPSQTATSQKTFGRLIPTKEELGLLSWALRPLINLIPTDLQLLIQRQPQDRIRPGIHPKVLPQKITIEDKHQWMHSAMVRWDQNFLGLSSKASILEAMFTNQQDHRSAP